MPSFRGRPVEWGAENVLNKLRAIDGWNRDLIREIEESNEKVEKSKDRDLDNQIEAWAYDARDAFKKDFSQFNTSSVAKKDRRRIKTKKEL